MRRVRLLSVLAAALILGACGAATTTPRTSAQHPARSGGRVLASGLASGFGSIAPPARSAARADRTSDSSALSVRATARAFSVAYARYLDGRLSAAALPGATAAIRAEVGPVIGHRDRAGELVVQSLHPRPGATTFDALLRDRAHTFVVRLTVAQAARRWLVVAVVPPDLDSILHARSAPLPQPPGSGAAEHAARTFMAGYLPWLYGEGPASAINGAAAALIAQLKTHPLRIPPMFHGLHARLNSLGMRPTRLGWEAFALVTDGRETYDLLLSVKHGGGRWLVVSVGPPG